MSARSAALSAESADSGEQSGPVSNRLHALRQHGSYRRSGLVAGAVGFCLSTLTACAPAPPSVGPIALATPVALGPARSPAAVALPAITAPLPPPSAATAREALVGWATTVNVERGPRLASLGTPQSPRLETGTLLHDSAHGQAVGRNGSITGPGHALSGLASYYWQTQQTASGETFDRRGMTAAHRTLPLGTQVRVTELVSGRSVIVRINDRGPFRPGRVIDLSEAAAEHLGMTKSGVVPVKIEVIKN